jgi:hypothetical protein
VGHKPKINLGRTPKRYIEPGDARVPVVQSEADADDAAEMDVADLHSSQAGLDEGRGYASERIGTPPAQADAAVAASRIPSTAAADHRSQQHLGAAADEL